MGSPISVDKVLVKARALHQSGNAAAATPLYEEVVRQAPEHVGALYLLGIAHFQLGNLPRSVSALQKALTLRPDIPGAHYNLGTALYALHRFDEAVHHYKQAIAFKPDDVEACNNLAVALKALGRCDAAIEYYQKALTLNPRYAEAYVNLANVLQTIGRSEEAIANYRKALALKPDLIVANMNCGQLLQAADRHEEAIPLYRKVLAYEPDNGDGHLNLGNALSRLARRKEALTHYERAAMLKPTDAEVHLALGSTLNALNRHEEAGRCFEKAVALKPDNADAHVLLGNMRVMFERRDDALQCYDRALALRPHLSHAKWRKALLHLSMGRFADGWELYEGRWDGVFSQGGSRRYFQPRWDGDYVDGSLLIWGEPTGVGDYILFAGMVPELDGRAQRILLEVEPRLETLFRRSFPHVQVFANGQDIPGGSIDAHESLAGLGKFLRASWEAFPQRERGYLVADDRIVREFRERLTAGHRSVVGISWSSAKPWMHEAITAPLSDFEALLRLPGMRFVDLQYGDTTAERESIARALGVQIERVSDVDNTNDLDKLAALICACDAVVSISNTTAHLAGALGKPTWVMVPHSKAFVWQWFRGRNDSPWYPRVRVLHQEPGQPWRDLVRAVTDEVTAFKGNAQHAL